MFSLSGNLLAGQHDIEKERPAPARPITVTFPSVTPPEPTWPTPPKSWTKEPRSGIPKHFLALKKPSDVTVDTLALLNVSFQPQCDFETLLSSVSNNAQSHLPSKSWLDPPDQDAPPPAPPAQSTVALLSNGRRAPDRNEFFTRAKEILFTNKDAFLSLTRKSAEPHTRLRLAHFRKFWEALDNMAYYWDNSLDEYIPPKVEATDSSDDTALTSINGKAREKEGETETELSSQTSQGSGPPTVEEPRKKARTEAVSDETVVSSINSLGFGQAREAGGKAGAASTSPPVPIASSQMLPARTGPPKVPWAANMIPQEKTIDPTKGSYRGYRIGNGAEMPDEYRLDCVRSFLEPIAWAFGATLVPHRRPPVLLLEHVRFPVRVNAVAWRGPQDRTKARQGWMEGPVLGVQCRPDVNFGATGNLEAESALDVVRELGGLLMLAQERQREGKTERRGGEGKWWTTKERWGGGPGGEVGEASGTDTPVDATAAVKQEKLERPEKSEEKSALRPRSMTKDRRRPTPAEVWKILRPGNPLWDPKVVYEAIGKDRSVVWDDIFMVSSLNHHISIVKLRVHPYYMRYITEGILPEETPADEDWCSPKLHRTRWYDLFNVEDRKEAMRGLWGVMSYLMRAPEKGEQVDGEEKGDVPMKEG